MPERVHLSRLSPLSFLERSAAAFPARVAVVDGDRRLTWAEVRDRTRRLGVGLQDAGIEKGDRVAFLAFNTPELLEAHYGVPAAGAVLVAINTRLTSEEIAYILDHSGARLLVVDAPRRGSLRRAGGPPRRRGRHDQHQLHERHDRPAEGGHVHASRRLSERAGGGSPRAA